MNGYLQSRQICTKLTEIAPNSQDTLKRIFSEMTVLVKLWADKRGIYNFKLGYLNGISIMVLVVRAIQDFFFQRGHEQATRLLRASYNQARQALIEHFFDMYATWPWNSRNFEERTVYLVHPHEYLDSI